MNYLLQKASEHIGGRGVRETDRPDENTVSDERMSAPFAHVVNCGESLSEARRGGPQHNTGTGSQLKKGDRFACGGGVRGGGPAGQRTDAPQTRDRRTRHVWEGGVRGGTGSQTTGQTSQDLSCTSLCHVGLT